MKTAIVTGGTKKDVEAMAVLALNIKQISPKLADELVIFHDGIAEKLQKKIQEIMPTRFIYYKCPINNVSMMLNRTVRYFSKMVFCKFECFKLLKEYETVIWTDYDVLIKDNIDELKETTMNMAFIINKETKLQDMFYPTIKKKSMDAFDMNGVSVTTPLFVIKREIGEYEKYYNWCIKMTRKYMRYLYLPEQCIFTMLIQYYRLDYEELDMTVYCMHPTKATDRTKILHAYGQPKFWNGLYNESWEDLNCQWKEIMEKEEQK